MSQISNSNSNSSSSNSNSNSSDTSRSGGRITVSVSKERIDDRVGITFRWQQQGSDSEDNAKIVIHGISATSLFAGTALKVGMTVESINGVEFLGSGNDGIDGDIKQAMKLLRQAEDVITIVASGREDEEAPNVTPVPLDDNEEEEEEDLILVPQDGVEVAGDHPNHHHHDATCIIPEVDVVPVVRSNVTDADSEAEIQVSATASTEGEASRAVQEINATPVVSTSAYVAQAHQGQQIVTATATKPTPDSLTGLGLKDHHEAGVVISSISPNSIFAGSNLRPGLKILEINNTNCQFSTKRAVALVLRNCEAAITIRCAVVPDEDLVVATAALSSGIVSATVIKPRQDCKVGLGISNSAPVVRPGDTTPGTTFPVITSIASDGLCGNTRLEIGMRVLSINGVSCRGRDDSVAMLRMAQNQLTIVAGQADMLAATVTKSNRHTKVGLNMIRDNNEGKLMVSSLPKNGLFAKTTDLKEGMQILQINGLDVQRMSATQVASMIARCEGNVTVLAKETTTTGTTATAAATSRDSNGQVSSATSQNTTRRTNNRTTRRAGGGGGAQQQRTGGENVAAAADAMSALLEMAQNFVDV